jgi:hypothetical protein
MAMINTIAFSSDLQKILLVDDANVFEYDLNNPKGVIIGTLGGQLAATAGVNSLVDRSIESKTFSLPAIAGQWTLLYEAKENRLSVIGSDSVNALLGIGNESSAKATGSALIQSMRTIGTDDVEGTKVIGTDDVEGTRVIGTDDVEGTRSIGADDVEGTKAIGTDDVEGTRSIGTDDVEGTKAIGTDDVEGTKSIGTDDVEGTRSLLAALPVDTNPTFKWYFLDLNKFILNIRRSDDQLIFHTEPK